MAGTNPKMHLFWRGVLATLSLAIIAIQVVRYNFVRSLNLNYFNEPSASFSFLELATFGAAAYLMVVALSGRWRVAKRR